MTEQMSLTRRRMLAAMGVGSMASLAFTNAAGAAPVRGGKMIYARYADSLELDPVWTDANVDIFDREAVFIDRVMKPLRKDFPLLAREVKPWPGLVNVEAMPGDDADEAEGSEG